MTLDVYRGHKTTMQQQQQNPADSLCGKLFTQHTDTRRKFCMIMQRDKINSNLLISQSIDLKFYRVVINRLTFDNMYKKYKFSI